MLVYNLTDIAPAVEPNRVPIKLKIFGKVVHPGQYVEVRHVPPSFLDRHWVSIDSLPKWYTDKKEELESEFSFSGLIMEEL